MPPPARLEFPRVNKRSAPTRTRSAVPGPQVHSNREEIPAHRQKQA